MIQEPVERRVAACRAAVAVVALGLGSLSAPRAQEPARQNPSFRAGATAVILDVVIRDRRGRTVRDVQRGEVTVLEDGSPREVKSFRLIERTPTAPSAAPTVPPAGSDTVPDALRYPALRRIPLTFS